MSITLKWYTGRMEIIDSAILNMRPAQLSQIVKTATENAEEAKAQIAAVINAEIGNWRKDTETGKKRIAELKKLLDVVDGRNLTKAEKAVQRIIKNVDDCRPQFKGVFESAGKSCVTDGYRLVRYAAPLDCFETVNPGFDVSRAIGDISAYSMRLELPDVKELKADIKLAKMESDEHIRDSYIAFVRQYDLAFAQKLEAYKAEYIRRMEQKRQEAHEERARREEQERLDRERAIADELSKAEQAIINGGYVENKMLDGKCVFLRLFDKYGIKIAPRSRGWIIDKLKSVTSCANGSATVSRLAARQGEKISQGFCDAYYELRNHLIKLAEEAQAEAEARAQEETTAVDMPALDRVLAVAVAVNDGAHDSAAIADYLNLYCNDMITEGEAKSALLRYTVPLALSAPVEAAQSTEDATAVPFVVAVHPAFLARSARLCTHGKRSGFNRAVPGVTLRSLAPPFCILNNTEYHNSA